MSRLRPMLAVLLLVAGCGSAPAMPHASPPSDRAGSASGPTAHRTFGPMRVPRERTAPREPRADPNEVRVAPAMGAVHYLAGRIGRRPGTSPAYARAATWVEHRFEALGWRVHRQRFHTPAGVSWGIPVPGGRSVNLLADRGDVRRGRPWLLVSAHLDTVPQTPGAVDDASGIGVLLAVAQELRDRRTRLPVVLAAFGSEEPRGPTDADHHYGSRAYVARLVPAERRSLAGMVSLDRVGVGPAVAACSARTGPDPTLRSLLAAARSVGVPTTHCSVEPNRSSDHWSFVQAGMPGARLGGTSYAAYHSPTDVPSIVDPAQLRRTARLVIAWLR